MSNKLIDKKISKLILKKSTSYLKVSVITFFISLILISTCSILFINQYIQVKNDFLENNNTHMITITSYNSNELNKLYFYDKEKIQDNINKKFKDLKFSIFNEYQFNIGLEDDKEKINYIYSIDDEGKRIFEGDLKDNTIYKVENSNKSKSTNLKIPIVNINDDGIESNSEYLYKMNVIENIKNNNPLNLNDIHLDKGYISFNTYKKIIEKMFNMTWKEFHINYDKNYNYGVNSIYKLHIYVDDISNVREVANLINDMGYNTTYMLNAFDNFDESLKNTFFISIIFLIIIFIMTIINLILSFNSYLKIQQKDMGILKQFGYSNLRIYNIFKFNINKIFYILLITILVYIGLISPIFIDIKNFEYIFMLILALITIIFIVNKLVLWFILNHYIKQDVLKLLKFNKEFE